MHTNHKESRLLQVITEDLIKCLGPWFLFMVLVPTQQMNGQELLAPTSNLNVIYASNTSKSSLLEEWRHVKHTLTTNHTTCLDAARQKKNAEILKLTPKYKLNRNSNKSSKKYSLITLRQLKPWSGVIKKPFSIEKGNVQSFHNIQERKRRDIPNEVRKFKKDSERTSQWPSIDETKLKRLVLNGLGMKKMPDMKKANISQVEYSRKYIEYLSRQRKNYNNSEMSPKNDLHLLSIVSNRIKDISSKRWHHKGAFPNSNSRQRRKVYVNGDARQGQRDKINILLHFPLSSVDNAKFLHNKIDEANIRLMLLYSSTLANNVRRLQGEDRNIRNHNLIKIHKNCRTGNDNTSESLLDKRRSNQINLKVYQLFLSTGRRRLLASRKIDFENVNYEETRTQWLEFDVTNAVRSWLNKSNENFAIEIQCDKCKSKGARILNDVSPTTAANSPLNNEDVNIKPVLNIIGHGTTQSHLNSDDFHRIMLSNNRSNEFVHHRLDFQPTLRSEKLNNCYKLHQRCCRHQLDVVFKNIKGFEFILQPKVFDAGYCHGRCPPRHNPAHHHALLQSLIWQEDHNRAPRPCCAPSKLEMLEILHVDEEHSDKLKISTWTDMQVIECACS
ncbi:hypothetical protein KR018_000416 [Drosophila ironensis]|nr:hypothetical protein KR018_000416 [Drosophila ironensis]